MKVKKIKQVGYGQWDVTMYCPKCGGEVTHHRTGHPWEEHHDDCQLSDREPWFDAYAAAVECQDAIETASGSGIFIACQGEEVTPGDVPRCECAAIRAEEAEMAAATA
jgi:hypothetical protein